MLKRTLCAAFAVAVLVAFSVPAFAGSHHKMRVRGTVESVDPAQNGCIIKQIIFHCVREICLFNKFS